VRYLLGRLLSGLVMVFALLLVTFALFWLIPAEPWRAIYPGSDQHPTQAQKDAAEHQLGVDRPVIVQYGKYVWGILHLDFGHSFYGLQSPVIESLKRAVPVTWSIVLGGALLLFLLAVPLGTLSALRENTWVDRAILTLSIAGVALHPFIIGIALRWGFATKLGWVPANTYCPLRDTVQLPCKNLENGMCIGIEKPEFCGGTLDWASHLALPWLTFAVIFLPLYMRMVRTAVLDVLEQPFVLTARAKGAGTIRLLRTHVLRNALLQPLTMIGMEIGLALTVSIYIEVIYNFSGTGRLAIGSLGFGTGTVDPTGLGGVSGGGIFDLPMIAGIVFMIAFTVVVLNLLVDIAYAVLDPRIKVGTPATAAA
jgi:peptide/nickel transport system permease protein